MSEQILVRVNPDVPPTGSDLGIVNAARKSYGRRSGWDKVVISHQELEESGADYNDWEMVESFYEPYVGHRLRKLKDKDKRLLEFLARGMTASDFDRYLIELNLSATDFDESGNFCSEFTELLWQWRNTPTHDTPFNHGFFSFEVKAPLFVRSHLVKHEYLIMSEYSRRYITDDVEFYTHEYREAAVDKKQGSGGKHPLWNHGVGTGYMESVYEHHDASLGLYKEMIEDGVAPEQARGILPQDLMTSWTWSGSMGAFANMCRLRLGSDTQKETSYVATKVYEVLKRQFPIAAPLLVEGVT